MASEEKTGAAFRERFNRLPHLADSRIQTNIQDQIQKLKAAPAWSMAEGRSAETLVKYEDFRIVLVTMKAGSRMNDHHADGCISVQVLEGKISLQMEEGGVVDLKKGDLLALQRGLRHNVEAEEESAFLLTIAWTGPEQDPRTERTINAL